MATKFGIHEISVQNGVKAPDSLVGRLTPAQSNNGKKLI